MMPFTSTYRSSAAVFAILLTQTFLLAQTPGQKTIQSHAQGSDPASPPPATVSPAAASAPTKSATAKPSGGIPLDEKVVAPDPTAAPTADLVSKQMQSVAAMAASIDKQKAAVQSQLGLAAPQGSFFTANWTTPAAFPLPHLVASCNPMAEADLTPLIAENAKKQDVKPELIRAVIRRESASYPCAVSDRGALGLMQLMPEVADQFGVDALDAAQNVRAGSEYLKQLLNRYKGDMKLALAAYNAGPERVDAEKKVPDIPETIAYVDSVLKDLTQSSSSGR